MYLEERIGQRVGANICQDVLATVNQQNIIRMIDDTTSHPNRPCDTPNQIANTKLAFHVPKDASAADHDPWRHLHQRKPCSVCVFGAHAVLKGAVYTSEVERWDKVPGQLIKRRNTAGT